MTLVGCGGVDLFFFDTVEEFSDWVSPFFGETGDLIFANFDTFFFLVEVHILKLLEVYIVVFKNELHFSLQA